MPLLRRTIPSIKDLQPQLAAKVNISSIVNDLVTGGTTVPLSAEQGKELKSQVDQKVNTADIVDDLTTGGSTVPASAETVKSLKALIDGMSNGLEYKGQFDASTGSWPTDPSQGDFYKVSVAGTVGGVDLNVGDMIIANKNVAGASATADWDVIDNTEAADILRLADILTATDLGGVNAADDKVPSQKAVKTYIDNQVQALGGGEIKMKVDKALTISGDGFTTTYAPKDGVVVGDVAIIDNGDGSYDEWEGITFSGANGTLISANSAYNGKTLKVTYLYVV